MTASRKLHSTQLPWDFWENSNLSNNWENRVIAASARTWQAANCQCTDTAKEITESSEASESGVNYRRHKVLN